MYISLFFSALFVTLYIICSALTDTDCLSTSLNYYAASAHIHTCLLTYHLQFTDLNVCVLTGSPNMCLFALSCPFILRFMHLCEFCFLLRVY